MVLAPGTAPVRTQPTSRSASSYRPGSPWAAPPAGLSASAAPGGSRAPSQPAARGGCLAPPHRAAAPPLTDSPDPRAVAVPVPLDPRPRDAALSPGPPSPGDCEGIRRAGQDDGWPVPGGPPLSWSDLLPGWPEDVTLAPDESRDARPAAPPPPSEPAAEDLAIRPPWAPAIAAQRS